MKSFSYKIGTDEVKVVIGPSAISNLFYHLSALSQPVLLVIDKIFLQSYPYFGCLQNLLEKFNIFVIEGGLESKTLESSISLFSHLHSLNFPRDGFLVAIGGGVIGDLVGFVASTYHRGVSLIHVPTTTTSMFDSSVGGKTGLNFLNQVNFIGTYYNPEFIFIDPCFLDTLSDRDLSSGTVEAYKMSLTTLPSLYDLLDSNQSFLLDRDPELYTEIAFHAISSKIKHVSTDFKEKHSRLILNFGHTFGQSFESYFGLNSDCLRHGEAVSLGLLCSLHASNKYFKHSSSNHLLDNAIDFLQNINMPTKLSAISSDKQLPSSHVLYSNLINDKKRTHLFSRFILLRSLHNPLIVNDLSVDIILSSFDSVL